MTAAERSCRGCGKTGLEVIGGSCNACLAEELQGRLRREILQTADEKLADLHALLNSWDVLTKGESPTTKAIRHIIGDPPTPTPLPSRLRPDAGPTPTAPSRPATECATRNLAPPAGQGPAPAQMRAILAAVMRRVEWSAQWFKDRQEGQVLPPEGTQLIDLIHRIRYAACTCDPRHLDAGGYDPGCPTHDVEAVRADV